MGLIVILGQISHLSEFVSSNVGQAHLCTSVEPVIVPFPTKH